jgi:HK97 family phage prohead protease
MDDHEDIDAPETVEDATERTYPSERTREVDFTLTRDADDDGDGLTLEGYAAVFNSPTEIEDRLGEYDEVILPGAFKRSINARTPALMFNHGKSPLWHNMPIGKIQELREDARGLFVKARLSDNWLIAPIRDAIRDGAVEGMSFRFEVPEGKASETRQKSGRMLRSLHEVKLHELGPVTFPAYSDTSVALRSLQEIAPEVQVRSTPEEPADPGTSNGPAVPSDPAPSHSPSTLAARRQMARQIEAFHLGARKRSA